MTEAGTIILMLTGAVFLLLAALGAVRMPDVYSRLGAATKAVAFGGGLMFGAAALHFREVAVDTRAIAAIAFLLITTPVAGHTLARAAYRLGHPFAAGTVLPPAREDGHPDPRQPGIEGGDPGAGAG